MGDPKLIDFRGYNELRQRIADLESQLAEVTARAEKSEMELTRLREFVNDIREMDKVVPVPPRVRMGLRALDSH